MTLFEELNQGLSSAIEANRSGKQMRVTTIRIPDVKRYVAKDIKRIRKKSGLTQRMLADFMGLSVKTIEAWERGVSKPTGPARRLLTMLDQGEVVLVES